MAMRSDKLLAVLVMTAALVVGGPAAAQSVKMGFVNVSKVLERAPQAEAARSQLEREFAPRDRELLAQQREIRTLEDDLIKNAAVMSDVERQNQEQRIRAQKRELRRMQDEFREDLNLRRSQELSALQKLVADVIQAMGKAESYDLIVTDGVVYAGEQIDITERVIDQLKAEFKGSGG